MFGEHIDVGMRAEGQLRGGKGLVAVELAAPIVIHADDRRRGSRQRVEQDCLRRKVLLHGGMVVEMVAREIREDRHREVDAQYAPLRQGMRGDFHHRARAPDRHHLAEHLLKGDRVGCGALGRNRAIADLIGDRTDQPRRPARMPQDIANHRRRCRLAVGPRDADHGQVTGRPLLHVAGQHRQGAARVRHTDVAHVGVRRRGMFRNHCHGPTRDGLVRVCPTIFTCPGNRHERRTGPRLT